MNQITDDMAVGGCKDFSEYCTKVGLINGLARAERMLLDLKEKIEEN